MQDSLNDSSRAFLLATVSPASACAQETLGTLFFARNAVRTRPT